MKPAVPLLAAMLALGGCSSPPSEDSPEEQVAATDTPPPPADARPAKAERAVIEPVARAGDVSDDGSIRIPRVSGIGTEPARRINAALDRLRAAAVREHDECRGYAEGRGFSYDLDAEVRYNADGLLSLRMIGDSFCVGANGTPLYGMHTFDLHTGQELDVAAATGLTPEALGRLAQPYYASGTECDAVIAEGPETAPVMGAFLDPKGLGVIYRITFGAGEGCSSVPAIIPAEVARTRIRFSAPLARAWSTGG